MRLGRVLCMLVLLVPDAVTAQVSGNVTLLSDYRFRGESLTEGGPALQTGINYDHPSGLFLGSLVSNVRIEPELGGLSAQLYGGYSRPIAESATWDIGVVTYVFSHPSIGPSYNYTEAFVGASSKSLSSRLYYTNSYFGGGRGIYLEVNATRPIVDRVSLVSHLGYLDLGQPREPLSSGQRRGLVDFLVGVNVEVSEFTLGLSVVGTNAQRHACPAGSERCSTTAVFALSRTF